MKFYSQSRSHSAVAPQRRLAAEGTLGSSFQARISMADQESIYRGEDEIFESQIRLADEERERIHQENMMLEYWLSKNRSIFLTHTPHEPSPLGSSPSISSGPMMRNRK